MGCGLARALACALACGLACGPGPPNASARESGSGVEVSGSGRALQGPAGVRAGAYG